MGVGFLLLSASMLFLGMGKRFSKPRAKQAMAKVDELSSNIINRRLRARTELMGQSVGSSVAVVV
jgi:hypothetical protein